MRMHDRSLRRSTYVQHTERCSRLSEVLMGLQLWSAQGCYPVAEARRGDTYRIKQSHPSNRFIHH